MSAVILQFKSKPHLDHPPAINGWFWLAVFSCVIVEGAFVIWIARVLEGWVG